MNTRRPAHAAGYSWRKWEDPIVYRRPFRRTLFWLFAFDVGLWAAIAVTALR